MKFTINQRTLLEPLEQAAKAISNKQTMPILDGIFFSINHDGLALIGSDGDTTIEARFGVDELVSTSGSGSFVVPQKKIVDTVKNMDGDISFVRSDTTVTVKCGRRQIDLTVTDGEEYPYSLTQKITDNKMSMKGREFKDLISKVLFATADEKEKAVILTGALFNFNESETEVIGCDRHRLAMVKKGTEEAGETATCIIVKSEDLKKARALLPDKELIHISSDHGRVQFDCGRLKIFARLLEGEYPKVKSMIPSDFQTTITVRTKSLIKALEFAYIIAEDEKTKLIKMTADEQEITLYANANGGKANSTLEIDKITGEGFAVSFNIKYALDAARAIDHEFTTINFVNKTSPIILKGEDQEDSLYLILPYKTND